MAGSMTDSEIDPEPGTPVTMLETTPKLTPFIIRGGRFYKNGEGQYPTEGQSGRVSLRNVGEMRNAISGALDRGQIHAADARTELKVLDQMRLTLKGMGASLDAGQVAVVVGRLYPEKAASMKRKAERRRVKDSRRKNRKPKKRRR